MWSTDTCYQVPLLFPNMADRLCETNLHVRITKIQLETNSPRRKRAGAWELFGSAGHWAYRLGVQPAKMKTAKLFTANTFTTLTHITLSGIKRRSLYNTVFFCGLSNAVFSCDRLNDAKPEEPLFPVWVKTRFFFLFCFFFKREKNPGIRRKTNSLPFTPLHQNPYSPNLSLYISFGTDTENSYNNQSFLSRRSFPIFSRT